MGFIKATKKESKIRVAIYGPSGSGKTFTCLTIAGVLGKNVGVIDTERGRAAKYADRFDFSVLELSTFSPREYIEAIRQAEDAGIDCLLIDSLSHAWNGQGGCLELVDQISSTSKSGNSFNAWGKVTPQHQQLLEAIMSYRGHVLCTMRAKTEYVVETHNGRSVPRKVGLAPVQRDGVEYEFDILGDMDTSHTLTITKSLVPELQDKQIHCPDRRVGEAILRWLKTDSVPQPVTHDPEVQRLIDNVEQIIIARRFPRDKFSARLQASYGVDTVDQLSLVQLRELILKLAATPKVQEPAPIATATAPAPAPATPNQMQEIGRLTQKISETLDDEEYYLVVDAEAIDRFGCALSVITATDAQELIEWLDEQLARAQDGKNRAASTPTPTRPSKKQLTLEQTDEIVRLAESLYSSEEHQRLAVLSIHGIGIADLSEDEAAVVIDAFEAIIRGDKQQHHKLIEQARSTVSRYYTDPDIVAADVAEWFGTGDFNHLSDAMLLVLTELIEAKHQNLVKSLSVLQAEARVSTEMIPGIGVTLNSSSIDQLQKAFHWFGVEAESRAQAKKQEAKAKRASKKAAKGEVVA